ncbi:SDR family oxidoreductase [Actinomyces sp. 594]|uniref:hypothetical protein n=1 Tax=Actinomyces sp. 594 TaxID=2057793 RepID=UPI001C58EFBD|nr:hypothetical protein [Actinomyces sp. 594]MBW3069774.1 SDR family oxidoreductase [Actinomyces sp. 594]
MFPADAEDEDPWNPSKGGMTVSDEVELSEQWYRRVETGHEGTHLAESRRTPGAFASGELDDDTNQVVNSSEWVADDPYEDDTVDEGNMGTLIACAVTSVGTAAITYVATKHLHPWWLERGRPAAGRLWRKVTHQDEENREELTPREVTEVVGSEVTPADLSDAVRRVRENLGAEEAQRELLNILVHAAAIASSLRRLSNAAIDDRDRTVPEWRKALEGLATEEVAACITSLLERAETDDELESQLAGLLGVHEDDLSSMQLVDRQAVAEILRLPED